jgi:Ca-activated chloride channel homolog
MVLLSDGKSTLGAHDPMAIAARAKAARIPIYAIALGTDSGEVVQRDPFGFTQRIPVPPDKETLRQIARLTGGRFFEAVSTKDAEQIYSRIGTRLTSKPVKQEITAAFAGGGFLLLLAGGALSLVWFARLP